MSASQPYASASLYVGDLPSEATEGLLYDLFKTVGPVASIRICRDAMTKRSLGYAYINYHDVADAERALETLNFAQILNKPCRIMWSHRDPSRRKSGLGNIFIKNLAPTITNSVLYDTFSAFGKILSCKVEVDNAGVSKGYGFVHFETQEQADQAAEKVNGMLMAEKKVYVGPFMPRKARTAEEISSFTNLFIKNLDLTVTEDELRTKFAEFGPVNSVAIMKDEKSQSKGFGFINYDKPENAAKAVESVNGTNIKDKQVYVGRAQKKQEREEELRMQKMEQAQKFQGVNIYIKNIDDTIDDDKLRQEFSKFGTITSSAIMKDDKTNSKGFGFVCFSTPEEATRAVTEMNGVRIGSKPLYVGLAQRKEQRRAQLIALHNQKITQMRMMNMNIAGQPGGMMPAAMYQGGPPVFYNPNMPGQPRMMGYPHQIPPRTRFAGGQPRQPGMPNNGAPVRQQNRGPRVNRGGQSGGSFDQQGQNGRGPQANFKYTSAARNQPPAAAPQSAAPATEQKPADEKMMLGEQIYAHACKVDPALAGKLTGMILEAFEMSDLYSFMQNPALLDEKINEALGVLASSTQPEGQTA